MEFFLHEQQNARITPSEHEKRPELPGRAREFPQRTHYGKRPGLVAFRKPPLYVRASPILLPIYPKGMIFGLHFCPVPITLWSPAIPLLCQFPFVEGKGWMSRADPG